MENINMAIGTNMHISVGGQSLGDAFILNIRGWINHKQTLQGGPYINFYEDRRT